MGCRVKGWGLLVGVECLVVNAACCFDSFFCFLMFAMGHIMSNGQQSLYRP